MKDTNRIVWADFLRLIAILMVICIHCADPFNVSPEARSNPEYNFWGSIYGAFLRPCVPLFVMLTGMLLLPVREETGPFYKKRMMRVLVPFVVWSFLYTIFPWLTGLVGLDSSILTRMFAYAGESPSQSLGDSLHNLWMIPFNFHTYTVHLWYIYMLLGLYLYLPFFSAWVKQASKKQIRIFLGLWCITLFLPYCREFLSENLGGTCAWNDFGILYYFSGFCGYLLLGSYLKDTGNRLSAGKTIGLSIILFAVGYAVSHRTPGRTFLPVLLAQCDDDDRSGLASGTEGEDNIGFPCPCPGQPDPVRIGYLPDSLLPGGYRLSGGGQSGFACTVTGSCHGPAGIHGGLGPCSGMLQGFPESRQVGDGVIRVSGPGAGGKFTFINHCLY